MLSNPAFHHLEVPCDDLELAERFYTVTFGARVYMRRDADRRRPVPFTGTIEDCQALGFEIDATYLQIGDGIRIGFLKRAHDHRQDEIDHLAFAIDERDLAGLARRLTECKIEVIDVNEDRLIIRDPFGLTLELWPRSVLDRMGVL
jgi:catechol 2,3-dioxygenase-like lactoylglutathione lyase family enzyme